MSTRTTKFGSRNSWYVIGLDISTSAVKVMAVSKRGKVLKLISVPLSHVEGLPEGISEMDPDHVIQQIQNAFSHLFAEGFDPGNCIGVAAGGAMHGLCEIDAEGKFGGNIACWDSTGDEAEGRFFTKELQRPIAERFSMARFLGRVTRRGESSFKSAHLLTPASLATWAATGEAVTLPGDGSGMVGFMDDPTCFDSDALDAAWSAAGTGIPKLSPLLPRVAQFGELIGCTTEVGHRLFGLKVGTPWAASCGDQPLGSLGKGCVRPKSISVELGSSIVVNAFGYEPILNQRGLIEALRSSLGDTHSMCCVTNGCQSYDDFVRQQMEISRTWRHRPTPFDTMLKLLSEEASKVTPGAEGLIFQPFYRPEGALLHPKNGVRASWLGVTRNNFSPGHQTRAAMEAPLYILRRALSQITQGENVDRVILSGGGAKDNLWPQIVADMLGCEVQIPITENGELQTEAVAFGAALNALAMVSALEGEEIDACSFVEEHVTLGPAIVPNEELGSFYDRQAQKFFSANDGLAQLWLLNAQA